MTSIQHKLNREVIFISKATPEDDEFVLWLAPRLEAAGYTVFADILNLEGGDRWRKVVTDTLQNQAAKMLLCCRDASLAKDGVQEEIDIARDLTKELKDPRLIIPLRLDPFRKVFGIAGLQYVDFHCRWAQGLAELLETLERQNAPRNPAKATINTSWEAYRRRLAIHVDSTPETLTSNWLPIIETPRVIRYFVPSGAVNHTAMERACRAFEYPAEVRLRGFFSFADLAEVNEQFHSAGRFKLGDEFELEEFLADGAKSPSVEPREASNMVVSMYRQAWEGFCREQGLTEYSYSTQAGFHVGQAQLPIGKKVSWGPKAERRSSMLRNNAAGKVWSYGVSAWPSFWPYLHFKLKARVLFATVGEDEEAGPVLPFVEQQHRARRSICKGWRNKQWHGRLMAFLKLLSNGEDSLEIPLSSTECLRCTTEPEAFLCPVSTATVDVMAEDGEESDPSTLGMATVEHEPA